MREHWNTEKETIDAFLSICERAVADDEVFKTFRHHPHIQLVIENSYEDFFNRIIGPVINKDHWVWDKLIYCSLADLSGLNPLDETARYLVPGTHILLSPTTVRYIYTAVKLYEVYGPLDGMNIVEIGGGYGGQCNIIKNIFKPDRYTIYDLPQVQELQAKYLTWQKINDCHFPDKIEKCKPDLVISWCAWSELSAPLKQEYFDKIIMPAEHFFFGLNQDIGANMEILSHHNKHVMQVDLWNNLLGGMVYTKP